MAGIALFLCISQQTAISGSTVLAIHRPITLGALICEGGSLRDPDHWKAVNTLANRLPRSAAAIRRGLKNPSTPQVRPGAKPTKRMERRMIWW